MNSFMTYLLVAAGGAVGTMARFGIASAMVPYSRQLPWGTIVINILGSFIIGFFGTLTLSSGKYPAPEPVRLFVMIGICGGFTTFSSFSLQTFDLLRAGAFNRAAFNIAASFVLCIAAVALGHSIAGHLNNNAARIAQLEIEEEG